MSALSSSPPPAIAVHGLSKRFGDLLAVDNIEFAVPAGSFAALLGGNGAGKTTTIAMLLASCALRRGRIEILGQDFLKQRKTILGRMNFQSPYADLPRRLSVRRNLVIYARLYGVPRVGERIQELAEALDLATLLDRPFGELSAGQRTRAGLAKAFINRPELVLLDEPTASLDPDTADWVRSYLENYAREEKATFLIASHNMPEVERLCDCVLMMRAGRIVDRGSPKQLLAKYDRSTLEAVFLDVARAKVCHERHLSMRVGAVVLRHWYLISGSLPRVLDLCYWPLIQMVMWGFIQKFMMMQSGFFAQAGGILLAAVMLWDVLFRGQIGLAISFFEEVYSRNLGHLLVHAVSASGNISSR